MTTVASSTPRNWLMVRASTFIFAAIIAYHVYAEPIKPVNVAGMLVLILGMYLMGK